MEDLARVGARPSIGRPSYEFLLERAATEHDVAERKREATLTKASAVATLAAALVAILAAPAFDGSGLAGGASRWFLLLAIFVLLIALGFAALALSRPVDPGDRPSREELDNWATHRFQEAEAHLHASDFTEMYVTATHSLRTANERAQVWLACAAVAVGAGMVLILATMLLRVV
jgi:hypothetical protein